MPNVCVTPDIQLLFMWVYFLFRNEPSFEFTCNHGGNTYIFGADDKDSIDLWFTKLHKVGCLPMSIGVIVRISRLKLDLFTTNFTFLNDEKLSTSP